MGIFFPRNSILFDACINEAALLLLLTIQCTHETLRVPAAPVLTAYTREWVVVLTAYTREWVVVLPVYTRERDNGVCPPQAVLLHTSR